MVSRGIDRILRSSGKKLNILLFIDYNSTYDHQMDNIQLVEQSVAFDAKAQLFMSLKDLDKICEQYPDDCVYKSCLGRYFIVLEKLPTTQTNEMRESVVDHRYAKCRGDGFLVLRIIDLLGLEETVETIENEMDGKTTVYTVGRTVVPDSFDQNLEKVCCSGIHYYTTILPAYFRAAERSDCFSGTLVEYYSNGAMRSSGMLLNGMKTGIWKICGLYDSKLCDYYDYEDEYLNGRMIRRTKYTKNGKPFYDKKYLYTDSGKLQTVRINQHTIKSNLTVEYLDGYPISAVRLSYCGKKRREYIYGYDEYNFIKKSFYQNGIMKCVEKYRCGKRSNCRTTLCPAEIIEL